jgi:hypothetical protein
MSTFDPDRSRCVDLVDSDANAAPLDFDEPDFDPCIAWIIVGGAVALVSGGAALLAVALS